MRRSRPISTPAPKPRTFLIKGGCLVVFPAGGVSTTPTIWHKRAIDAEWKNFTARLIAQAKAPVAPVYFAGQNSRLFQLASHVSMTLRLSLLFKEVHDRIGSEIHIRIGELVPYERLAGINDRQSVMDVLKNITYSLGGTVPEKLPKAARQAAAPPAGFAGLSMSTRIRVGLFVTCLVDLVRPQVGFAAVKLLEQAGCDVEVPNAQTCCGQPAWNAGADKDAQRHRAQRDRGLRRLRLCRRAVRLLRRHDQAALSRSLREGSAWLPRARALAAKTHELTSFLVKVRGIEAVKAKFRRHGLLSRLLFQPPRDGRRRRTAQPAGHRRRTRRSRRSADKETCCGFGGLFSVKYPEISERIADNKIADVLASGAETLTGGDLGCLLHLAGRMQRDGKDIAVRHVAEILADMGDEPALGESQMNQDPRQFPKAAREALNDPLLRPALNRMKMNFAARRAYGVQAYGDFETLREAGRDIRDYAVTHLDTLLETFESERQRARRHRCIGRATPKKRARPSSPSCARPARRPSPRANPW